MPLLQVPSGAASVALQLLEDTRFNFMAFVVDGAFTLQQLFSMELEDVYPLILATTVPLYMMGQGAPSLFPLNCSDSHWAGCTVPCPQSHLLLMSPTHPAPPCSCPCVRSSHRDIVLDLSLPLSHLHLIPQSFRCFQFPFFFLVSPRPLPPLLERRSVQGHIRATLRVHAGVTDAASLTLMCRMSIASASPVYHMSHRGGPEETAAAVCVHLIGIVTRRPSAGLSPPFPRTSCSRICRDRKCELGDA